VADEHLLDLARVDVEAAAQDEVLLAVDDAQEAALVLGPQIAGAEPAVDDRRRRVVGALVVAGEDVVPADDDLADLAVRLSTIASSTSGSAISTSTPQMGWPIEPGSMPSSRWLTVAVGEVSDSP
jgi:hypothetical protein